MLRRLALVFVLGLCAAPCVSAQTRVPHILPLREQAAVVDRLLAQRLETVIPALMRREKIDVWIVAAREYNEDPVIETMLPATWMAARRRTILVFIDHGPAAGVERLAVARYDVGPSFRGVWDPAAQPDQWAYLAGLIAARAPRAIAVNRSTTFGHADGLTATEYEALQAALPAALRGRLVSGERLAVGWLETRIPEEMVLYPQIVRIAHAIIEEGFSEAVIQPGVTTTDDVVWWYRERVRGLGLETWFHPSVSVQRDEAPERSGDFASRPGETVILPGDLLHVDFGIRYLRLNTDTQQHAYVLRPGEREAPAGLQDALSVGNRLQDLLTNSFKTGRTGNEILRATLDQARAEGIQATVYTHPLGFHGHGAGPAIGMWDRQDGVPGTGDYPLFPNTVYSIELNAAVPVPEWGGKSVRIMLEEDAAFDGEEVYYLDGRQTRLMLIPRL